jgi:NTP pyrophosphatase (non-canonical NTP hydrolase)
VVNEMVLSSGSLNEATLSPRRNLSGRRPQAFRVSTERDCRSGCQVTRSHAHANSSDDVVPHRLGAFMHVAIHKAVRLACRPWLTGSLAASEHGGSARRGPTYPLVWEGDAMDIRAVQKLAWENKLAKGFNTTDVPLEFCLLSGELAEAFDAWRKGRQDVAEELADTAIFLLGLAEMIGADLQEAVEAKLAANDARVYRRLPNGFW